MKMNEKIIKIILIILSIIGLSSCGINWNQENKLPVNINQWPVIKTNISRAWFSNFKTELAKKDSVVIDIRTPPELQDTWIISGAINIDYYASNFENNLELLNKDQKYLIYCRSGSRSGKTLSIMKKLGFTNVTDLNSGINWWFQSGWKTEKFNYQKKVVN